MLTSFANNIETICQAVIDSKATKIIDIGCAWGKYGLLIREAISSVRSESGDLCPDMSDVVIDAVESGKYFYEKEHLGFIYNHVLCVDMFKIDPFLYNKYELMLLIDVVEHHEKPKVLEFLKNIKTKVLISSPKHAIMYIDRHYDIDVHVSQWEPSDFDCFPVKTWYNTDNSWIVVLN